MARLGTRAVHRHRRRQHDPRQHAGRGRRRADERRLHGHARHGHQRARRAERDRAGRHPDPGDVGDPDGGGVRALHPPPRHPPPREGAGGDLRRRHRQPVLHHRHGGGPPRRRDGLRRHPEGHAGGRGLLGRPEAPPRRPPLRPPLVPRRPLQGPEGDGRVGDRACAREQYPDHRLLAARGRTRSRGCCAARGHTRSSPRRLGHEGPGVSISRRLGKRMDGALDVLRKELQGLRTGRASPSLLEPVDGRGLRPGDAAQPGRARWACRSRGC